MSRIAWRLSVLWMATFAALHVYWGMGGSALLPPGVSVVDSATLFAIDLVTIPLLLAGAVTSWMLRPGQRLGKLSSRRWLVLPATVGAAVMVAHALGGAALLAGGALTGSAAPTAELRHLLGYESYWLVGGITVAATIRSFHESLRWRQSLHRNSREASTLAAAPHASSTTHSVTVA